MPFHFTSLNRREFLGTLGAAIVTFSTPETFSQAASNGQIDDQLVYLLNDTHIGEKHPADSPVPSHLRQVVNELVERKRRPVTVLVNGDLALKDGQPGDYRYFSRLIQPLRESGIDVHLTMGNHDHRDVFFEVMNEEKSSHPPLASRHIAVVKTRQANFFLLDSLIKTLVTQGELGRQQLSWLANSLDALPDKPAIVVAHHNPRLGGDPKHYPGGLIDSEPLWDVLVTRPHVKAYVHGHVHHRGYSEHQGIHIINTPATSYVANPETSTTGWTTARLGPTGAIFTTHSNHSNHPWHGQSKNLIWRS